MKKLVLSLVTVVLSVLVVAPVYADASTEYFRWPAEGTVTSEYGMRWGDMHEGIDIAKKGDVPVTAAYSGYVTRSTEMNGYGNIITIRHKIGGDTYETAYAHLRSKAVSVGDYVDIGDFIGWMGNTGDSSGQHLHFEVHKPSWRNSTNPRDYLGSRAGVLDGTEFNPTNGSYGYVQIDTSPEYGVNVYDAPNGDFVKRVPGQSVYGVYAKEDGYYNLGGNQWVKEGSVNFKRFRAYVNYDHRYGVNVYDAPSSNGDFIKKVSGNDVFNVYEYRNGYYNLGAGQWVKGDNLLIIKPLFN
ncbi:cell wall endopeptidase [Gracilibacillus halophilus YIM-C55.5]|uniref:Cell wall endopeptidase n=1 Tax=Gracilibacillus halophilus YIM-C55.5 TaxID=1308866 RepID=N4WL43_9BACI|nr:M23 family metallopeptidase [Gracilibacillus halophilus]ENH96897.1 cell wall endopeptidase [Gracilibacillus halophilus YIM-C55.5]